MNQTHKLTFWEKFSYGIGDMPEVANSIIAAFLTMFYTDSIGMAAAAVGTMFFISKLFDGISDLAAGTLIDNTKSKWGKARPWLLWLAIPTGLAVALIFFVPKGASPTGQLIYAFLTYNLFTTVMYTITGIARSSLLSLMTQDWKERSDMSVFGMFIGLGGTVLGCSVTFPLLFKLGGETGPMTTSAWQILFCIYGTITTIGLFISFFLSKEYVVSVTDVQKSEGDKIGFVEGVKLYFSNKYLLIALFMTVLVNLAIQLPQGAQTYFYTYTMNDPMLTTSLNLVGLIPMLLSIVVVAPFTIRTFGKKKSMYIGMVGQIVAHVMKAVAGFTGNVLLLTIFMAVGNLFVGSLAVPVGTLAADGIDYGEYKTNRRINGLGASVTSFSQKLSSGLAAASVGWVLGMTGYVANAVQNAQTNFGIIALFSLAPAAVLLICLVFFKATYHYDDIADEVVNELNKRKQAAGN